MARPRNKRPVSVAIIGPDKAGRYCAFLTVGVKANGRPDRRKRSGRTPDEVADKIRQLEDEMTARGRVAKPGRVPTVAEWLQRWLDEIVSDLRAGTLYRAYGWAIRRHLVPGLGAHRLDRLEPHHIEKLYRQLGERLSASSVHGVHRVLRAACNEAVRRGVIASNPVLIARSPRLNEDEVTPLHVDEVRRILAVCEERRNGTRWTIGLPLGLRQGEALGLPWMKPARSTRDTPHGLDPETGYLTVGQKAERRKWRHGCGDERACAARRCRTQPCRSWHHGCGTAPCGREPRSCPDRQYGPCRTHKRGCPICPSDCTRHASSCPQRTGGGIVMSDPKSRAGRRRIALAEQMLSRIKTHRKEQLAERLAAGPLWEDHGLVWCQPDGKPIDARQDWAEWKEILKEADVRNARVHDGRHTAATMLLLQGIDSRTVMEVMGWGDAGQLKRYQHVVDELRAEAARRVGDLLWGPATTAATRR